MHSPRPIVAAFRGLRYNHTIGADLSPLLAPPYDVVMRDESLSRHPHNFVHIELPRAAEGGDRYQEAAALLTAWREQGVLQQEEKPALYLLEQEFSVGGATLRRRGVLCLVRLPEEDHRYVLSHEGTLPSARADRLQLMRACRAMTSPVMVMHEDPEGDLLTWLHADRGEPPVTGEEWDGVRDRLWVVTDEAAVADFQRAVGGGPLVIADGHHRFETAMTYRREMRELHPDAPPDAAFNYALMLVTSTRDDSLVILPTHRLLSGLCGRGVETLKSAMDETFEVRDRPLRGDGSVPGDWDHDSPIHDPVFAVYCGGDVYYNLRLREEALPRAGSVVERLDVSLVHRHLIDPVLGACGDENCNISYLISAREAVDAVRRGAADAAVLLRPTRVRDVLQVAKVGERMPGKSTYFYPKVPAGLVLSEATPAPVG